MSGYLLPYESMSPMLSPVADDLDGVLNLLFRQFREHRQRDTRGGVLFGVSERANHARILAPRETLLLMDRDRVVRLGVDAVLDQIVQQRVAVGWVLGFDLVQVEHVAIARAGIRQVEKVAARQPLGVFVR